MSKTENLAQMVKGTREKNVKNPLFLSTKGTRYMGNNALISMIICYNKLMKWKNV